MKNLPMNRRGGAQVPAAPLHSFVRAIALATVFAIVGCTEARPARNNRPTQPPDLPKAVKKSHALVLSAPPRESASEAERLYQPLARYLGQALGRPVEFRHSGDWGVYQSRMLAGDYDILFDGPHFNGYRAAKLDHTVLVKVEEPHELAVITRVDSPFVSMQKMAGRTFCTHAPPNLGALVLLQLFDNPARQPAIVATESWTATYRNVVAGKCVGGVMPVAQFNKLNSGDAARILYKTAPMPNQAFSAGPRLGAHERGVIAASLLSDAAREPLRPLQAAYKFTRLVPASNEEYLDLAALLTNAWIYRP